MLGGYDSDTEYAAATHLMQPRLRRTPPTSAPQSLPLSMGRDSWLDTEYCTPVGATQEPCSSPPALHGWLEYEQDDSSNSSHPDTCHEPRSSARHMFASPSPPSSSPPRSPPAAQALSQCSAAAMIRARSLAETSPNSQHGLESNADSDPEYQYHQRQRSESLSSTCSSTTTNQAVCFAFNSLDGCRRRACRWAHRCSVCRASEHCRVDCTETRTGGTVHHTADYDQQCSLPMYTSDCDTSSNEYTTCSSDNQDSDDYRSQANCIEPTTTTTTTRSSRRLQLRMSPKRAQFFACQKSNNPSSTSECNNEPSINAKIIEALKTLEEIARNTGDQWRALAYRKAVTAVTAHKQPITSIEQAKRLGGVGQSIANKVCLAVVARR
jgi:hypothetical protein